MAGDGDLLHVRARVNGEHLARPRLDVELDAGPGITVVMGHSGAGKSTLLSVVAGLLRPDLGRVALEGRVLFDGEHGTWVAAYARQVALVFQSLALFPHLTARENVAYGLPAGSRTERRDRRDRAHAWLERCRVAHVAERVPATFSGGEAQRVALARALASEPKLLLLDEPFSALDAPLRRQLGDEVAALVAELRIPVLLVTHDATDAAALGSRTVELHEGRLTRGP